jgi:hypothetical protein
MISVACAVLTVSARPCGALLAAMVGVGGVSLRSADFRTLLWLRQDSLAGLFRLLVAETVLLAIVLLVAVLIIGCVRSLVGWLVPRAVWRPPTSAGPSSGLDNDPRAGPTAGLGPWGQSLVSATLALLIGLAVVAILLQSPQRGQVLFAVLAAFTLAGFVTDRVLPAPRKEAYLLAPLAAGVVLYALASVGSYGTLPQEWANVPVYAQVLPVDWLTAGCGGVMLGCWTGQRTADDKLLEQSRAATER